MNSFQTKYPAFFALIALVAQAAKDTAESVTGSEALLQKLIGYENLVPLVISLAPQAGQLVTEAKAMQPADIVAAAETLVTDLAFSSEKAQKVVQASFGVAEWLAAGVSPIEGLVAAIKG